VLAWLREWGGETDNECRPPKVFYCRPPPALLSSIACSSAYLPSDNYATRIYKPYRNHYRPTPLPQRLPPLPYTTLLTTKITHQPITVCIPSHLELYITLEVSYILTPACPPNSQHDCRHTALPPGYEPYPCDPPPGLKVGLYDKILFHFEALFITQ